MILKKKLEKLNYFELSHLLTVLRRDKQTFTVCLIKTPEHIDSLILKVIKEVERRALLIPSEKLLNDLGIKNLKFL